MNVTVVSDKTEAILETPAIVSSYNIEKLMAMSLRDLKEVIEFLPGFQVSEGINGNTPVKVRRLSDPQNQKILFLLDDTPYI